MVNFVTIDGVDYSNSFLDWNFEKSNVFFSGSAIAILFDGRQTIYDTIEKYMEIKLYNRGGVVRFTGVISDIKPSQSKSEILTLECLSYWTFALREPIERTFTNQSASQIIASIIATELAGLNLSTADSSKFVATTIIVSNDSTGTKMIYRGNHPASKIFEDLAFGEDYVIDIDEDKDVIFRSNIAVDSGIHLIYGGGMLTEDIVKLGGDLVNVVKVRGAPGQPPDTDPVGAIVEDDTSIAKLAHSGWDGRLPIVTITRTELGTPSACQEAGLFEIKKRNQEPDRGPIKRRLNFSADVNELITLTIPHKGITAKSFMIQRINHSFSSSITILDVVYYTRETADLVKLVMEQNRGTELYLVDDALVFTKFKTFTEETTITTHVKVESQVITGAVYGEFDYSTKYYGQASGSAIVELPFEQITVLNKLFENWLRIVGQIATVPNVLDASNSFIALGFDLDVILVTDTTLANELFRKGMEAGFPNTATANVIEWQIKLTDSDVEAATIRNLGLFDAAASGNMLIGGILSTNINKVSDQDLIFTIKITIAGASITSAGSLLLRDILIGDDVNYLDNTNAAIEIIMATTAPPSEIRTAMTSGFPKFKTSLLDQLIYEIAVDTTTYDGEDFDGMDLYNKTSGGIQTIDAALAIITEISLFQNINCQMLWKLVR